MENEKKPKAPTVKATAKPDNIFKRITRAMDEIEPILKNKRNKDQNFTYRGIDDVMNGTQPILKKCGIFIVPEVLDVSREKLTSAGGGALMHSVIKMRYTFYGEDGSSVPAVVIGEAMDTGDKSITKAQSIAYRVALCQIFCIPTGDAVIDPDKESYKLEAEQPAETNLPPDNSHPPRGSPPHSAQTAGRRVSNWTRLKEAIKGSTVKMDDVVEMSQERYQTEHLNNLTPEQLTDFLAALKQKTAKTAAQK
jgi:hypothetical protein